MCQTNYILNGGSVQIARDSINANSISSTHGDERNNSCPTMNQTSPNVGPNADSISNSTTNNTHEEVLRSTKNDIQKKIRNRLSLSTVLARAYKDNFGNLTEEVFRKTKLCLSVAEWKYFVLGRCWWGAIVYSSDYILTDGGLACNSLDNEEPVSAWSCDSISSSNAKNTMDSSTTTTNINTSAHRETDIDLSITRKNVYDRRDKSSDPDRDLFWDDQDRNNYVMHNTAAGGHENTSLGGFSPEKTENSPRFFNENKSSSLTSCFTREQEQNFDSVGHNFFESGQSSINHVSSDKEKNITTSRLFGEFLDDVTELDSCGTIRQVPRPTSISSSREQCAKSTENTNFTTGSRSGFARDHSLINSQQSIGSTTKNVTKDILCRFGFVAVVNRVVDFERNNCVDHIYPLTIAISDN